MHLLGEMLEVAVQPNVFWLFMNKTAALLRIQSFIQMALLLQVYTFGSAISCCEKASRWPEALALLGTAAGEVNAFAFSGAISVPTAEDLLTFPWPFPKSLHQCYHRRGLQKRTPMAKGPWSFGGDGSCKGTEF